MTSTTCTIEIKSPTKPNPVNSLGSSTRLHISQSLQRAWDDPSITSIILTGHGSNFSAGADITEFDSTSSSVISTHEQGSQTTTSSSSSSSSSSPPSLIELCNQIESSAKPIIAALQGVALGGGLEVALSCHYRIASSASSTKFGLPETKIGLIPGAGATQRLPRLCGVPFSLNVITTGRMIGVVEAKKVGLIDYIVSETTTQEDTSNNHQENLLECALRWAKWAELMPLDNRRVCNRSVFAFHHETTAASELDHLCDEYTLKFPPKERGGEALHAAVTAVQASYQYDKDFHGGMQVESQLFMNLLLNSQQGRALRYAFFAERAAQRGTPPPLPSSSSSSSSEKIMASTKLIPSQTPVGIIGAGTMGSGIAVTFLHAGYNPVILVDNDTKGLQRGIQFIHSIIQSQVQKNKVSLAKAQCMKQSLQTSADLRDLKPCRLIIEAVYENMSIKREVFTKLNDIVSLDTILVTNTSTLDIDVISSVFSKNNNDDNCNNKNNDNNRNNDSIIPSHCQQRQRLRKQQFAGMHFFSPAYAMKLIEIVASSQTSTETIRMLRRIAKSLGKIGVVVRNCGGFVGNRMLFPYTSEMIFLLQGNEEKESDDNDGIGIASVMEVDDAMVNFGMAMGPFVMSDLAGNDVGYFIRKEKGLVRDEKTGLPGPGLKPGMRYSELGDELVVKLGRVGQKALKGWYDYDPKVGKGRKPIPSREVSEFIAKRINAPTHKKRKLSKDEIIERLLFPLVNEGFKILEENIARQPSDIDVIYLYGYGWPAWRGGPMYWADHEVGLARILSRLEEFHRSYPGSDYFIPSELLRKCVSMNLTVAEYYKQKLNVKGGNSKSKL